MEFSQSAYHKPDNPAPQKMHWGMNEKSFCMLLHLSQLAGMVLPGAGLVLPVVMWATEKDNSPLIDEQGKVVLNWMISSLLYGFVAGLLCFWDPGTRSLINLFHSATRPLNAMEPLWHGSMKVIHYKKQNDLEGEPNAG